jgi:membrane protein implicated in regulation of membrane protease activity
MFPQGILSQAYFMSALVGGGFLIFNFVMGHMDDSSDDAGHHGHDFGHDGDDGGDHDGGEDHGDHQDDTTRYSLVTDHRVQYRVGRFVLSVLSPMSISIFLAFFGLCGYAVGYLFPAIGYFTLIPAVLAGFAMINIFKSMIAAMMRYGTSSTHMRSDDLIGHVAEVLIPIAENRPGEVTYVIQSKIYSSAARSKPGTAINKGTKVMIVERDGPIVFVEPYKNLLIEDN